MPVPFAINGLGRIGRALLRISESRRDLALVAINDQASPEILARLLAHDTLHGPYPGTVAAEADALVIDGRRIPVLGAATPGSIPWTELGTRTDGGELPWVVVEATGRFRNRGDAARHLGGSVEKVVVSATAEGVDATFCLGVNDGTYDPSHHTVISNASCTANCLATVLAVLSRNFDIEQGLANAIHCYTNSQRLMDMSHSDPRRARAATVNIIPTTSDAVDAVATVLPELAGRIDALACRVPVPGGSLVDLVVRLRGRPGRDDLARAFRDAEAGAMAGILATTEEELVSVDFIGNPASAVVDLPLLAEVDRSLFRVVAWYDNEWGYASRLAQLLVRMGAHRPRGRRPHPG